MTQIRICLAQCKINSSLAIPEGLAYRDAKQGYDPLRRSYLYMRSMLMSLTWD